MPNALITIWLDPPPMDTGAPMPAVYSDETGLTCAYFVGAKHHRSGSTALLHFEGVLYYAMGYPNDEALDAHPLYEHGLKHYGFHLISESPLIADLDRRNRMHEPHVVGRYQKDFRHWVVTFHDETLEVVGRSARVLGVTTIDPTTAVRQRDLRLSER